uniref:Uncharacterized protein n=1 Tax=Oryza punctata TaxID=4537 RepID=A0A0E0KPK9_ORYPU
MADGASANPGDPPSPAARSGQRKHVPDWLNSPIWSAPPPPARHRAPGARLASTHTSASSLLVLLLRVGVITLFNNSSKLPMPCFSSPISGGS